MLITTANDLGTGTEYEPIDVIWGISSRARHIGSTIGAGLKSIVGGKIEAYNKLTNECRNEAVERLKDAAEKVNADAVLAFRFDT